MDWSDVTAQLVGTGVNTAIPGSEPVVAALTKILIQCQDEQLERLRSIEKKVDRLLDGPWMTGRRYLEEATLPGRSAKQQDEALSKAAAKLRDAIDLQEADSITQASVLVELAAVLVLQGDRKLAEFYARQALLPLPAARVAAQEEIDHALGSPPSRFHENFPLLGPARKRVVKRAEIAQRECRNIDRAARNVINSGAA
jgi:hypothetical protein